MYTFISPKRQSCHRKHSLQESSICHSVGCRPRSIVVIFHVSCKFHGRARRLALGFVEVCSGQMKFQKLSFPLSAVCDQRTSSLPHLDHRNYLRFRARQLGTANHARTAAVTRFALSTCHNFNVLSHFALFVSSIFVPIVKRGSNVVVNMICCFPLPWSKHYQNRSAEVRPLCLTRYSLECMHRTWEGGPRKTLREVMNEYEDWD